MQVRYQAALRPEPLLRPHLTAACSKACSIAEKPGLDKRKVSSKPEGEEPVTKLLCRDVEQSQQLAQFSA